METEKNNCMRIGQNAPAFTANSTFGEVSLKGYEGKWLVFFSHPGDFTPVCTTEFLAFTQAYPQFLKMNCMLLGISEDSNPSHLAWVRNIYENTGIEIPFPIVDDSSHRIAKEYGMLSEFVDDTKTVRNVYIICPKGHIRAILTYPMTTGRNIDEILRLVKALQLSDEEGVSTPANWKEGMAVMKPAPRTYADLLARVNNPNGLCCMDWYLCFTDSKTESGT